MKENINYLGMVNLLRSLQAAGLVSRKEARKIAARLKTEIGSDVIVSLWFLCSLDIDILNGFWYCVLQKRWKYCEEAGTEKGKRLPGPKKSSHCGDSGQRPGADQKASGGRIRPSEF